MWHLFEEQEEGVHIAIRAAEFALLLSRILLAVANKSVFSSCFFAFSPALALASPLPWLLWLSLCPPL
jgi:hypothetical protein